MSLRWRIALPLGALLITLLIAVTVVAVDRVSRAVERRLTSQAERLARLIKPFPSWDRSSRLLGRFREAFDAEIVISNRGSLYGTTNNIPDLKNLAREDLSPAGDWLVAWAPIDKDRELYLYMTPASWRRNAGGRSARC